MLLKSFCFLFLALAPAVMYAEEESDSTFTHELQEVVIEASKMIHKSDMDVYYPSKSALDHSQSGVQLLKNLMIPALSVDDIMGSIKARGQNVEVRINGKVASMDQLRGLLPESVKRVEWIDDPGLLYNGASYVLNFIVMNPSSGGSLSAFTMPALNIAFGRYFADLKINKGASQWSAGTNFKLAENLKIHRDYKETFTYPTGDRVTRQETPLGGQMDNTFLYSWLGYSYVRPDTTVFMVDLTNFSFLNNKLNYYGLLNKGNATDGILLDDKRGSNTHNPVLSVYLQQNFANRQSLIFNLKGSLFSGRNTSDYIEHEVLSSSATNTLTDIHIGVKERNLVFAFETDYIKKWRAHRFTAGATYTANRNRSIYENLNGKVFHQTQDKFYGFAEYFGRYGDWTTTAGLGVQYAKHQFKESGQSKSTANLRPQATLTYSPTQVSNFQLRFRSWQTTPSLDESNPIPQRLDSFQWRVGNDQLYTYNSYLLTLQYAYSTKRVNGSIGVSGFTAPHSIAPYLYWSDNKLITTYENSKGLQSLSFYVSPQFEIIPEWLTISGTINYQMERSKGTGYTCRNNSLSGNAALQLMHAGFVFAVEYYKAARSLSGEKITWGEDYNTVDLTYKWQSWQFGVGMLMPFGKYDQGEKNINHWNTNEQHMRINMNIPYLTGSYNLQWGRQSGSAEKLVDVKADADRTNLSGR